MPVAEKAPEWLSNWKKRVLFAGKKSFKREGGPTGSIRNGFLHP
jgi:hypothetical protein